MTAVCHLKSQHLLETKFQFHYLGQSPFQTRTAKRSGSGGFRIIFFPKRNTCNNAYTVPTSSKTMFSKVASEQFVVISTKALHSGVSFTTYGLLQLAPALCCDTVYCQPIDTCTQDTLNREIAQSHSVELNYRILLEIYSTQNYVQRSLRHKVTTGHLSQHCETRLLASSRRSVRMQQLASHLKDLHETLYLRIGRNSKCKTVTKIQDIRRHVSILWCEIISLPTGYVT